jgi:hypothetical protein
LNREEHEKSSEMCVWIVGFGQKLRNWEKANILKSAYMSLTPFLLFPANQ